MIQKTVLGRTGLKVTAAGLGCGGHSRLGLAKYGSSHAANLVRTAFDSGINFFDTATAYGTQDAVGQGLEKIPRDQYVLSTKFPYKDKTGLKSPEILEKTVEESLSMLRTDYIDIYHIHGVYPEDYTYVVEILLPVMKRLQQQGKIRYLGITEIFAKDTSHQMLKRALSDNYFDVAMIGYNLLNPSAAIDLFPLTIKNNIGVLCMFAVRSALSNPEQLKIDIGRILENHQADTALLKETEDLSFLVNETDANTITEAAYRYCRHTAGVHVTLTGTGSEQHLKENIRSIQMPPLPDKTLEKLHALFGKVNCVSGQ